MTKTAPAPLSVLAMLALSTLACAGVVPPEKVRFNEQVRPILSTCFSCHGPDEKHRKAGLRLDVRESAIAERDGVRAIVPGKPEQSDLLSRVVSADQEEVMPPPKAKRPCLTSNEVALLRKWIEEGAQYEGHWAFQPIRTVTPPTPKTSDWARNPVDQFILSRLEREGIKPSPEADRTTLLRRLSLDLTGLLPTLEELDSFTQDPAPDAYEKAVERLLASPHYGERWGRHWLDQARFADSNGYSIDSARAMWPYRDWVIAALNADMAFDRFTIEQLAGDLLPHPTTAQLVASAFHRNTLINEEGGVNPEQMRIEAAMDRTATTGTVWLGLTVGCAQCHTHKFDPIPHREYYQLYAFFNSGTDVNNKGATVTVSRDEMFGKKPIPEVVPPDEERAKRQLLWEKSELERGAHREATNAEAVKWSPAQYVEYGTTSNAGFRLLGDNSLLSDGRGAFNDTYRVVAKSALKRIAAVRLRVLTDPTLPQQGPGMAGNGNFVLTHFSVLVGNEEQPIAKAFADHEQPGYPVLGAIDHEAKSGWAVNVGKGAKAKMNATHEAVFIFTKPIEAPSLEVRLFHELNQNYLIGRFALEFSETAPPDPPSQTTALLSALRVVPEKRSEAQRQVVEQAFAQTEPKKKAKAPDLDANVAEQMVMKDLPQPRETFLLQRGDFLRPDKELGPLKPGVISAINAAFKNRPSNFVNRLDLAHWLVSEENPLTPRVTVNRVWMRYFGRGLVETDEDFGTQGSVPTHPDLLDWLSHQFIEGGWKLKTLHRLIVTSATYRQSSQARPDLKEHDPRNLLLARQERLRVEAEIIRDAALCASGLLDPTLGGPSVRPPQPDGVFSFTQNKKSWVTSSGPSRFRRGLYTMFYRSAPYPLLTTFDSPNFQSACTRRGRSDTPLQSLTLANDPAFMEIAQGLAARLLRELPGATLEQRLRLAFRLSLGREPQGKELSVLTTYVREQATEFSHDGAAARAVAGPELAKSADPAEAAGLVAAARALFNTDNFITRE